MQTNKNLIIEYWHMCELAGQVWPADGLTMSPCVWEPSRLLPVQGCPRCPCTRLRPTTRPTSKTKICSQRRPKILFPGRTTTIRKHKLALCNPSSPRQMTCGAGKDRIQVPKGLLASSGITSTRRWTSLCTDDRISLLRHHCKAWSSVQCISLEAGLGSNIKSGRMSAENPIHLKRKCARHELSLSAARMCI